MPTRVHLPWRKWKAQHPRRVKVARIVALIVAIVYFGFTEPIEVHRYKVEIVDYPELVEYTEPPDIKIPDPPKDVPRPDYSITALVLEAVVEVFDEPDELDPTDFDLMPPEPTMLAGTGFVSYDKPPKPWKTPFDPDTDYPAMARTLEIEGIVLLKVMVGKDGKPISVTVLESDNDIFNENAVRVVMGWTFRPAEQSGNPVKAPVSLPLRFILD